LSRTITVVRVRVSVVGCTGAGKTTFGSTLATILDVPFVELDGIFHQAGWTHLSDEEFREAVAARVAGESWVIDGNYAAVRPLVLDRADTVVWLDYGRALVMERVIRRSVSRAVTGRELWNGNRESARQWADSDHPIRWAWSQHGRKRVEYEARFAAGDPEAAHLRVHRFTTPRAAGRWLDQVRSSAAGRSRQPGGGNVTR
jgi:adenylate kinase family enzyme